MPWLDEQGLSRVFIKSFLSGKRILVENDPKYVKQGIHRETKSGCAAAKCSRLEMLRRYRRTCDYRRWDKGIDSEAIIAHVERLIRIIEKRGDAWNYI